jgi:hypothetical protein
MLGIKAVDNSPDGPGCNFDSATGRTVFSIARIQGPTELIMQSKQRSGYEALGGRTDTLIRIDDRVSEVFMALDEATVITLQLPSGVVSDSRVRPTLIKLAGFVRD